jgi:hypothetical protein
LALAAHFKPANVQSYQPKPSCAQNGKTSSSCNFEPPP